MSAWLVAKGHIDALVQACVVEGLIPLEDATETGKMLWLENHRSLHARYGDEIPDEIDYEFEGIEVPLHDGKVGRLILCYDYQSCEHAPEWGASEAHRLVWELYDKLAERHPDCEDFPDAAMSGRRYFDSALEKREGVDYPWGINHIREAV